MRFNSAQTVAGVCPLAPLVLLLANTLSTPPAHAEPIEWREAAQTAVHLLDYVGVDYPAFVRDGAVLDEAEYAEQREFAAQVVTLLAGLPDRPGRAELAGRAEALGTLIGARAPGPRVAAASAELRWAIIDSYSLVVAPKETPDLARGRALYQGQCASCHGSAGRGDGPLGTGLDPAPADFTDAARIAQRSAYGLYSTITLGVAGTGMAAFRHLAERDRWALAFFVGQMATTPEQLARGAAAWESGRHVETFVDLAKVATLAHDEVTTRLGAEAADVHRWLRAHPEALTAVTASPIHFTIVTLRKSLEAHRQGDPPLAQHLAVTAYLEGFELLEAGLDQVDAPLRTRIEQEMMAYRSQLKAGASLGDAEGRVAGIIALLRTAERRLARGTLSGGALFLSAALILLREGLEAILILAAIVAFLVRSGRRDVLSWIHAGWAGALLAGAATWFTATWVVAISGAARETTEAVSALCAAGVLIYVGVWLHSKSHAHAWDRFVRERVGAALNRRTLWALAGVSFLAVYREAFEVVLFYQALGAQAGAGGALPLLAGVALAAAMLALVGWAVFRYGLRLPIGRFFAITSVVLAVLAVVFVGQGVSALQEAGAIAARAVVFIRVPELGIFPTVETLAAQLAAAVTLVASFACAGRRRLQPTEMADASRLPSNGR